MPWCAKFSTSKYSCTYVLDFLGPVLSKCTCKYNYLYNTLEVIIGHFYRICFQFTPENYKSVCKSVGIFM